MSASLRPSVPAPLRPSAPAPLRPSTPWSLGTYVLLVLGALIMLFPLWWMFVVSLSTPGEASAAAASVETFSWWPHTWKFGNYVEALKMMGSRQWLGFIDAFSNTVVITTLSVLGLVLSCSLVGYAFARLRFRGREPTFIVMLSTLMLPPQVTMIPMFIMFRSFGWVDTLLPLVVPMFFGQPFYIFLFRQFFSQVPEALVEAARIDGCGHLRIWWSIMLPMCKPVIAITAVFTFIFAWNDFLGPLIYLHSENQQTLAVALNSFKSQYGDFRQSHWLMAASIVTMIPCVVLFFVAQKQFVGGLSLGAVKG